MVTDITGFDKHLASPLVKVRRFSSIPRKTMNLVFGYPRVVHTDICIVLCKKICNHNFVDSLGASIDIYAKLTTMMSDSIR